MDPQAEAPDPLNPQDAPKPREVEVKAADLDHFLQLEVDEANLRTTPWIGVTLLVHGVIITGRLISGDRYYDLIAEEIEGETQQAEDDRNYYRAKGESYRKARELPDKELAHLPTPTFIHLENASIVNSPNMVNLKLLWRGRISSVDGWFRTEIGVVK